MNKSTETGRWNSVTMPGVSLMTCIACCCCCLSACSGFAQSPASEDPPTTLDLRDDELAVSGRYARFERLLSQMADVLGRDDPERAELLRRAVGKGREEKISERIGNVIALLESDELGSAVEQQESVATSLRTLLVLLQSEDRRSSVERERERLNELLNNVRGLVEEQRSARAAAQNSETPSGAAGQQKKVLDNSDALIKDVKNHDAARDAESMSESDGDGESDTDTDTDTDTESDTDGESDGESEGDSSASSPSTGEPSSPSGGGEAEAKQTPGSPQLEAARQAMQQALKELREQQRKQATDKQDEAITELLNAAGEIEEQLRQLREEEKEMILAALEARFQRMLAIQTAIHEGTVELSQTPKDEWLDRYFGRCRELAQQQSQLAIDCSQTTGLLREDGTSVSILLAVEGIEADMNSVAAWLQESAVADLTQSVQNEIMEALKELIEATQREMQDMKSDRDQQSQPSQGDQQKPPLVELMAEIKVLRSLQSRVNRRTRQVDDLLLQQPVDPGRLMKQLDELAARQQRLIESARELAKQMDRH
jgi:hypothetical protein